MTHDRFILWSIIVVLGLLIVAQVAGNGMLAHWQAQDEKLSHPDPAYLRMLAADKSDRKG